MNKFIETMENTTYTDNGAMTNKSSYSGLVDFFFHGAALRNEINQQRIIELFQKAFEEHPEKALRILFYIRDIRYGQGERRVFRVILNWIAHNNSTSAELIRDWLKRNLYLIPVYGRYDDLFELLNSKLRPHVISLIESVLLRDIMRMSSNKEITLLAKWLPSENASSIRTKLLAKGIIKDLGITPKAYRKHLTQLRKYLDIVETKVTNKDYSNINYSAVPSRAALKYRNTFTKQDTERYIKYLNDVKEGKAKINTATLYPYDVLSKYTNNYYSEVDPTIELMWKNLPDYVPGLCGLVVADTSGSMQGRPMDVCISLALYIAERNKNETWKDYFISFSENPVFHKITGNNLLERASSVRLGEVANTNLMAVFDLILQRALMNKVPKEDMPKVVIIISDMEFDSCTMNNSLTNFQNIRFNFDMNNYTMPTLIFWNVNSMNTQCPVTINDQGVVLLSGCSPTVFKYALGSVTNSYELINEVTNSYRYEMIQWNK